MNNHATVNMKIVEYTAGMCTFDLYIHLFVFLFLELRFASFGQFLFDGAPVWSWTWVPGDQYQSVRQLITLKTYTLYIYYIQ